MMRGLWIIAVLIVVVTAAAGVARDAAAPGRQVPQSFSKQVVKTLAYDYLLYLPKDYGAAGRRWPLVLFLHGAGERGSDIEKIKRHGPPKLVAQEREFPFILVSPQCPAGAWWDAEALNALLDEIVAKYAVDEDRVYLTGLSMGGSGTWDLAIKCPQRFAAIVPICGAGAQPYNARKRLVHVPVWTFHGAKDETVPIQTTELMVESVKKGGGDVKFTVYPEAGHDSWTQTYENPEMWDWLLSHKRQSTTAPAY